MKILVLTHYFWPENFGINDVVRGLAERGHSLTVYTGMPNYPFGKYYPGYGLFGPMRDRFGDIPVLRAPVLARGSGSGLRLAFNYLSHALSATVLAPWLIRGDFDAILVYQPSPATIGISARALRALKRAPVLFWVQDLWPESLEATGAIRSRVVLKVAGRVIRWIYRGCDRILVQSQAFVSSLNQHGVPAERIAYLPNSADAHYRRVNAPTEDSEAAELPRGFRVMYAGNIGAAQDFPTIVSAAESLRTRKDIQWIVFGDGRMRAWVESQVRARGLEATFHLLGQRPAEAMPRYFAHADVLLATLRREPIFALTIPSKLQAYLASGKPIIGALEGEGERILKQSGAGWAVPPEDPAALVQAIVAAAGSSLAERRAMAEKGEAYFQEHFQREKVLSLLERELRAAVSSKKEAF